ncbi:MAG TPA: DUF4962 domain-containing protein [Chryseosolibacter sp.]|nr:DUF4962 domain-containing protein [Chryseosolibacter sp.]
MAGQHDGAFEEQPLKVDAVHMRYLERALPANGIHAQFNPPVLRWPITKDAVAYDVRLSRDSLFDKETVHGSALPWAMFNAHKRLQPGDWYWQYRIAGENWSSLNRFIVDERSIDLVSPPAEVLLNGIPATHPRVLTTQPETLRTLMDDADALRIVVEATAILGHRIPREHDGKAVRVDTDKDRAKKLRQDAGNALGKRVFTAVNTLSQAWLLSGEKRFAERALQIALGVAKWDPDGVTGFDTSDFADARCMLTMALAFDTYYNDLNDQQKTLLIDAIKTRANRLYNMWVSNQEARLLSGHVWQHMLHYFFQTAIALYNHEANAATWLAYSYELFVARAPILGGTDGGWIEGASYFKMNMETLIEIPLLIKQFTGFDFIAAHPWYINQVDWLVYHVPPGSACDGFGDNAEDIKSPGAAYVAFAGEIAKLTGSPVASWYEQKCREYENVDLSAESTLRWVRVTRTRDLPTQKNSQIAPFSTGKLFAEVGLTAMHTDPMNTENDLMVAMRSSPFGCYGHYLADQNAFNILYGGKPTFYRTGYKVTMSDPHRTGWYQHTKSQNGILVNGEGQPYSTEAFGTIRRFVSGDQIAYALGDASNAYSSRETKEDHGVKKFYRHLLLLKPDIVVVYDELEAAEPVEWSWLIHSMSQIQVDESDNSFHSDFGTAVGVGALWSATPFNFVMTDTFDVPAVNWRGAKDAKGKLRTYEKDQWHLKAVSSEKLNKTRFLAVLQISPGADIKNLVTSREGSLLSVSAGRWRISANVSADASPEMRIENEDGSAVFRYGGSHPPTLIEQTNDGEKITEAAHVLPWHVKLVQSENSKD